MWYLSSDAKKGTHAIFGAQRGARLQSDLDIDQDDVIEELQQGSVVNTSDDEQVEELQQESAVNTSDGEQHDELQHELQEVTSGDEQYEEITCDRKQHQRLQQESEVSSESHAPTELLVVDSETEYRHQQPVISAIGVPAQPVKMPSQQSGTDGSHFRQQASSTHTRDHS